MEIKTLRLLLREFTSDDWPAVLAYQSDPRYLRYYSWETRSAAEVKPFVQQFIAWQAEQPRLRFQMAINLVAEQKLIGNCGLRLRQVDAQEADLGYEIAPSYWGQGYATEAAQAMLSFGFDTLHLHRIWASVIADNQGSIRVLEKLGLRQEGHLRENQWMKGRWWDTLVYGILEQEWQLLSQTGRKQSGKLKH